LLYFSFSLSLPTPAVLGFEFGASCLLNRHTTIWATPLALFPLVIFEIGYHIFPWADLNHVLLTYTSHRVMVLLWDPVWDYKNAPPYSASVVDMRPCLFCLDWPQTVMLWISASQVAKIIGVNYYAWLVTQFLDDSHSDGDGMEFQCTFNLYFFNGWRWFLLCDRVSLNLSVWTQTCVTPASGFQVSWIIWVCHDAQMTFYLFKCSY
jgi:hypothetical protein